MPNRAIRQISAGSGRQAPWPAPKSRVSVLPPNSPSARPRLTTSAADVAQAEPATPRPKPKMNIWLNRALTTAATTLMASVNRVRPMPLKKPVSAQAARPAGPPTSRGNQYS